MRAFLAIMLAMLCVACSKADVNKTSSDLKAAGTEIKNSPAVKDLGSDIKVAAKHTGAEIKKGAEKAKVELAKAGDKAKTSLHEAGDKAKAAGDKAKAKADDTTRHDSDDKG